MANSKMSAGKIVGFTFLGLFILIFLGGSCFFAGLLGGSLGSSGGTNTLVSSASGNSIYEIRLEGTISASGSSSILSGAGVTPESIIEQALAAEKNPGVKAILLRIDSGGGSAAASQEIFEELKKITKPIVVSVSDICASGAYYIACAADKIVANKASSVGSIGVIMQIPDLEGLYDKLGIKYTTIKQGKYKDAGSSSRPLTPEEEQLLQNQTEQIYEQFIQDVAASRKLPVEKVREIATGWVYIGTEALNLGLIDKIGTYRDAEMLAAQLGGIKGEPNIIGAAQISLWDTVLKYFFNQSVSKIINADSLGNPSIK